MHSCVQSFAVGLGCVAFRQFSYFFRVHLFMSGFENGRWNTLGTDRTQELKTCEKVETEEKIMPLG